MNIEDQVQFVQGLLDGHAFSTEVLSYSMGHVLETLKTVQAKKPTVLWHHGNPPKRGVYPVKCDGPNPNRGYRYWDGERWHAHATSHTGAHRIGLDPKVRVRPLTRPVLYATKGRTR